MRAVWWLLRLYGFLLCIVGFCMLIVVGVFAAVAPLWGIAELWQQSRWWGLLAIAWPLWLYAVIAGGMEVEDRMPLP